VLAGIFYRGLIPSGFMPAFGEAARHGSLLVVCHHGETRSHDHDGSGSGDVSLDQCPFGAAAGPALASAEFAISFVNGPIAFRPGRSTADHRGVPRRLQPPARAPPMFS
jgi:hypothetical protein